MNEKLLEWADKIEQLLATFSEPAIDLVLETARLAAIQGVIAHVASILLSMAALYGIPAALNQMKRDDFDPDRNWQDGGYVIWAIGGGLSGLVVFAVGVMDGFSVFDYVGMFRPELYIAHKVLGL